MNRFFLTMIIFLLSYHLSNGQQSAFRWGLIGEKNKMVVDETEILVIEWMEYVFFNDLEKFKTYTSSYNCYDKNLTDRERERLINFKIDPNTKPDSIVINNSIFGFLFNDASDKILINFRNGLKGPVCIPIDTVELNKTIKILKVKSQKDALYRILTLPITGITYEQAIAFCNWRNNYEKLNYKFKLESGFIDSSSEFYYFTLPTKEEFAMYNTNLDSIYKTEKKAFSNFNYKNCTRKSITKYPFSKYGIEPIEAFKKPSLNSKYHPKKFIFSGLINVQGNVAEMSSIKGESLGGSYFHFANQSYNNAIIHYDSFEQWLGFRCIGRKTKM